MSVCRAYSDTKLFCELGTLWVESSIFEIPFFIILCVTTCKCVLCTIYMKKAALYWSDRCNIRKQRDNIKVFGKLCYWLQQSCTYFKASPLTIEIRPCMFSRMLCEMEQVHRFKCHRHAVSPNEWIIQKDSYGIDKKNIQIRQGTKINIFYM
jgi:hypothetical protein